MHSYIRELKALYQSGKVTRREFLYYSALLGLSAGAANAFLAACGSQATPTTTVSLPATPTQPMAAPTAATGAATKVPVAATATTSPAGTPTAAAGAAKRGGTLRYAERILKFDTPWAIAGISAMSVVRQQLETLTYYDVNNVTKPRLAESWEPSEDLLTWTFHLRKGVKWSDGTDMTADDVVYSIQQMTKKDVSPGTSSYLSYVKPENIKASDPNTVVLSLDKPQIAVAEHLALGVAFIMPNGWSGNWIEKPIGTGPFTMSEYRAEERVSFKRREDYWDQGADGKALPYLDEVVITDLGTEASARLAALSSGQADYINDLDISLVPTVEGNSNLQLVKVRTAHAAMMRTRLDKEPFTDKRVRNAMKAVQDRQELMKNSYLGYGDIGYDHHIAPIHPEFSPEQDIPQDIAKAKQLLSDAGHPDGLNITMDVSPDIPWELTYAQVYKEQAAKAGINIEIRTQPSAQFVDKWNEWDFCPMDWLGRPLGMMILDIAYRCNVAWNETRFCNADFDKLLDEADMTLDVEKRREIFSKIQPLLREEGGVLNPFFTNTFRAAGKKVNGFESGPFGLVDHRATWLA